MRNYLRVLVCVLCGVSGAWAAFGVTPAALADATGAPLPPVGAASALFTSNPLVVPSSLEEGEQRRAARAARMSSPEAIVAREVSQTAFAHLNAAGAAKLARKAFPAVVDVPDGGTPPLRSGEKIVRYVSDNAAQLALPDGRYAVIESLGPMAKQTSRGHFTPLNLSLSEAGGSYAPRSALVPVRIPRRLSVGVSLLGTGVAVTPVGSNGAPLGGSQGAQDGQSVLFANTQVDTDTLVKPATSGFAIDAVLRSPASPQQFYYRLSLPQGARLMQEGASGGARVVKGATTLAQVTMPFAEDAAGTEVPVRMSVSGETLVVGVAHRAGSYQYPIEVDPEVKGEDSQLTVNGSKHSNWEFYTSNGKKEHSANFASSEAGGVLKTYGVHEYKEKEVAFWVYQTRGVSKIYEFEGETEASNKEDRIESIVELQYGEVKTEDGITEEKELLSNEAKGPVEYTRKALPEPLCPKGKESCVPTSGNKENAVHFQQSVVGNPTSKYSFSDALDVGTVYIAEPEKTHSTVSFNTSSPEVEVEVENSKKEKEKQKRHNVFDGAGWLSEYDGAFQSIAKDTGIGVASSKLEYDNAGKWEVVSGSEHNYVEEGLCKGVQCESEQKENWTLNKHLPNGEDEIRYRAEEAFGDTTHETESLETEGVETVKVDYAKPHGIFLVGLPYGNELSEKTYELTAYATDGEGSTIASSGIASIELYVNGKSIKGVKAGEGQCSVAKGECTASAKYQLKGAELGAGHHAIVIVAKDNAGNEGREEETISIRHSTPVPLGPGSVDLQSGDFALSAGDVSLGSGLSVSRTYSSRDLTVEGPLGPQWSLGMGSEEQLVELVDKSVLVTSGNGGETIFAAVLNSEGEPTGKFEAPPGDSNLALTLEENGKKEKLAYYLKDPAAGTSTKFVLSSTGKVWLPTVEEGPVPEDTVSYLYETVEVAGKKVTRPSEVRAATDSKVSCSPKMEPGCRALKFTYATKTKSGINENPSEWGEYEGRLSKVSYEGYNPATKKMTEPAIAVAEYSYDKQGRLRAEWDPRISPALKTTYGYDAEGHVTVVNQPGVQPYLMRYGTSEGDASAGRLLSIVRPPASTPTELKETEERPAPANTALPTLSSSTPQRGTELTVSNGTWSNSPLAYSYQWEDCNASGGECAPIPGAVNPRYTPRYSDEEHTLVVQVTATNANGSTTAATAATGIVPEQPVYDLSFGQSGTGTLKAPTYMTVTDTSPEKVDVVDTGANVVQEYSKEGAHSGEFGSEGAEECKFKEAEGIDDYANNGDGVFVVNAGNDRAEKFNEGTGACLKEGTAIRAKSVGIDIALTPLSERAYIVQHGTDTVSEFTIVNHRLSGGEEKFGEKGAGKGQFNEPSDVAISPSSGEIYVTDTGNNRVEIFKEGGAWKSEFGSVGSGPGEFKEPTGIVVNGNKEWVVNKGNSRVQELTSSGSYITQIGSPGTGEGQLKAPIGIAVDGEGNIYVVDAGNARVEKWWAPGTHRPADPPLPSAEKPTLTSSSITTVEYGIPVSGAGAPHNMSASEIAKWGQKPEEAPVEATAIFPPDSPQGWPASNYTRASVYYLDDQGRLVNTATPSTGTYGAISTMEYNETNDVVRTLSPDNRATALEAGTKSEEVANLLSTFDTYRNKCSKESEFNEERESTEPGTRLCEAEGPAHAVKYMVGKEQKEAAYAREHVRYFYDEKVPAEGPSKESFANESFDLVTESKSLTEIVNSKGGVEEEIEPRTTVTSYSGQNNLGWKLRAPTSVTDAAESGGAKVTHTTLYNENGQITETRGPEGSGGNSAHDSRIVYYSEEENKEYTACGKHPEWAGLMCETLPAKQPETTGIPNLPVTKTTYNVWNESETVEETFPKSSSFAEHTRTTKDEYDAAGRMKSSEKTSTATTETIDRALPKVANVYSSTAGLLEKQEITTGGKTKTIATAYNTLGQVETYTDADGNVAKFKYGGPETDGLPEEVSDGSNEGKSNQKYTYSETTKQVTKLVDSAAGTFTASYDAEGKLSSEVYPNGMCASDTYNSVGEATHIEYTKTSTCSASEGVWFSETKGAAARGETMGRTSTLASENYNYDTLGRLTEVQETPAGEYCKTRSYTYDEESNRTKFVAREPNSKKECATEGGTEEKHTYDEADRLTDTGITYDPLGNTTKLPAGDAEGHALESSFYVDNAIASQTQNGVTNNYYLDPDGRTRETITGTKKVITHYDGSGEAVAWTCEGPEKSETCESTAKWTRDIPGIDGTLAAVENGTGKTAETAILQLHDLEGDVVATIKDKTGETKLESTYNSTEFGVPNGGKEPPKYAWLGAGGIEKSLASGVITYGATSYVPQTGKALQSEEVAPPGLEDGSGGTAASFVASPWNMQGAERVGAEAPGREAEREREAAEEACRANLLACPISDPVETYSGLLSPEQVLKLHQYLESKEGSAELAGEVGSLVPWLGKALEAAGEGYAAWLHGMNTVLESCGNMVEGLSPTGRCYVVVKSEVVNVGPLKFVYPYFLTAEMCLFESYDRREGLDNYLCIPSNLTRGEYRYSR